MKWVWVGRLECGCLIEGHDRESFDSHVVGEDLHCNTHGETRLIRIGGHN